MMLAGVSLEKYPFVEDRELAIWSTPTGDPASGASPGLQAAVSHDYSGVACCSM